MSKENEDEEVLKIYHFAREYREDMVLSEEKRIRGIRENIPEKLRELKNRIEKCKKKEPVPEEVKMAEEAIEMCVSRYGENLEKLQYASSSSTEGIYRIFNDFVKVLGKLQEKQRETSDKSIKEL